jgi:hypothetical protein
VEWEPALATRFLRNAGATGRWLAVAAPTGTTIDLSTARSQRGPPSRLARATVGTSTGYGAGPSDRAWIGLGHRRSVDVAISRPGTRPVELRRVRTNRLLVCRG